MSGTKKQETESDDSNEDNIKDFGKDSDKEYRNKQPEQEFQVQVLPVAVPFKRRVNLLK